MHAIIAARANIRSKALITLAGCSCDEVWAKRTNKEGPTIGAVSLSPDSLRGSLRSCGYQSELLRSDFVFGENQIVPLVGFAQLPADSRSACLAVLLPTTAPRAAVEACRPLGAPLVFVCSQDALQWWKQGATSAEYLESIPTGNVEQFFQEHRKEFSPDAVYRAKTWGRFQTEYQLSFVDLGLMPLVESEVGNSIGRLIERNVTELKRALGWKQVNTEDGHWLLKSIFWLVSGKILQDKQVPSFQSLNLRDPEEVFRRVGNHYGARPIAVGSRKKHEALCESARIVSQFSSLVLTTTEALAYVYENTLITKETRTTLGTHSTPSYLVDYVVGNLADWIAEIPLNERSVYEPACGHAAFLVSAMRLLTELLPAERAIPRKRGQYLRSRLHGNDVDSFALELARLSLTLTDIPNPDGWDLHAHDMFVDNRLAELARKSTILLANPPFDNFTVGEQRSYREKKSPVHFINKSAEMLWRTLINLPEGGVFGVVLPQSVLHSKNAEELRKFLASEYELKEVCLFPDSVFSFSDAESAIVVGRRKKVAGSHHVRYRRVRERELPLFRSEYAASTSRDISQSRFRDENSYSLRLPDLEEVWNVLAVNPALGDVADVGQGLIYHGRDLPRRSTTYSRERFAGSQPGFVLFESGLQLHDLPRQYWMNLNASVIRRPVSGTIVGTPQVLLNYAPASRGPWRLKALIDRKGHAVTSRFIAVRPASTTYSIETLWALLNSPVANAYAFSHLGKRDNIVGDIRRIPVPKASSFESLHRAASNYLEAASQRTELARLQELLLRLDCEVLNLYSLPLDLETSLLSVFTRWERVGVPFQQCRYLPSELSRRVHLSDFIEFQRDWSTTNRERGELIDKSIAGTLSPKEQVRLEALEAYADYHLDQVAPRSTEALDELEKRLFSTIPMKDGHD
jgi:N-6 DNA Methylase